MDPSYSMGQYYLLAIFGIGTNFWQKTGNFPWEIFLKKTLKKAIVLHLLLLTLQLESIDALKDGILHVTHPPISLLHSNWPAATLVHSAFLGATAVYPGWQTRLHMVSLHSIPSSPATCPSTVSMAGHFSTAAAWTPARTKLFVSYQLQFFSETYGGVIEIISFFWIFTTEAGGEERYLIFSSLRNA